MSHKNSYYCWNDRLTRVEFLVIHYMGSHLFKKTVAFPQMVLFV